MKHQRGNECNFGIREAVMKEVDIRGRALCSIVKFHIGSVEPLGSTVRVRS